jgi:hypothetical protein
MEGDTFSVIFQISKLKLIIPISILFATGGAETAHSSEAPEFTTGF